MILFSIIAKELRIAYSGLSAFLILSLLSLYFGFFFNATCLIGQTSDMAEVYGNLAVALLMTGPVMTMRAFADERRQGTLELLYTAPVPSSLLVLGKFLAIFSVWALFLAFTFCHALFLAVQGPFVWSNWLLWVGGSLLMGGAVLAVGLLASALTENQLVAALLGLAFSVGLFLFQWVAPAFSGWLRVILEGFSFTGQLMPFLKGVLDLQALFFFLGVTSLFLFATQKVLDARRWSS